MTDRTLLSSAREIQRRLESFYALEAGPDVTDFVRIAAPGEREQLLVREGGETLELGLVLPRAAEGAIDEAAQVIEGVSHFVYLAERARTELGTTELEMELQAEVDKFVLMAFDGTTLAARRAHAVRRALFEDPTHLHAEHTERGHRYRLASQLAEKLSGRLVERWHGLETRRFLQRFYRSGQTDKIRLAVAA